MVYQIYEAALFQVNPNINDLMAAHIVYEPKVAIISCVITPELYFKAFETFFDTGSDVFWYDGRSRYGLDFLLDIFQYRFIKNYDILVVSDEDNIIVDKLVFKDSIIQFWNSEYSFMGCRDGGDISIRHASPIMVNTFFTYYKVRHVIDNFSINNIKGINSFNESDYINWKERTFYKGKFPFNKYY